MLRQKGKVDKYCDCLTYKDLTLHFSKYLHWSLSDNFMWWWMVSVPPGPVLRASHQPWTSVTSHYSGVCRAWNTNQQLPIFLNHTCSLGPQLGYRITVRKMFSQSYLYVNVNIQQIFSLSQIESLYASLYCRNPLFNAKLKIPCLELFIHRTGGAFSPSLTGRHNWLLTPLLSLSRLLIPNPRLIPASGPQEPACSLRPWITTLLYSAHPRGSDKVRTVRFLLLISW